MQTYQNKEYWALICHFNPDCWELCFSVNVENKISFLLVCWKSRITSAVLWHTAIVIMSWRTHHIGGSVLFIYISNTSEETTAFMSEHKLSKVLEINRSRLVTLMILLTNASSWVQKPCPHQKLMLRIILSVMAFMIPRRVNMFFILFSICIFFFI